MKYNYSKQTFKIFKNQIKFLKILSLFFLMALAFTSHAASNFSYQPLAPIPGVTDAFINNQSTTGSDSGQAVKDLIGKVFKFGVGLCSALAVIMIIYGGFLYVMGAASESNISKGREVIQGAITGLVLVLCIVIILKAVNNSLLSGDLFDDLRVVTLVIDNSHVEIQILPGQPGYPYASSSPQYGQPFTPPPISSPTETTGLTTEEEARRQLAAAGISVNKGPCANGERYQDHPGGCTSVGGLPQYAINDLIRLKQQCNCDVTITGGTESGHAEHGSGKPVVDLAYSSSLNSFLGHTDGRFNNSFGTFTHEGAGGNARGTSTGDHWHIVLANSGG